MDKKIKSLGKLKGKVLLFGGVYSNLQALEALICISENLDIPPENCICTGDIIGYCAQPEETLQLFHSWGAHSILGNVEIQLRSGAQDCGCEFRKGSRCDDFSQQWYPYAQSKLSQQSYTYLNTLPDHIEFTYAGKRVMVVHGSWFEVADYIFKSTPWETKKASLTATQSDVIVAGHCGIPFQHEVEGQLWLNPGVIGMPPNDGTPLVWYALLDDTDDTFSYTQNTFAYDHIRTHRLMKEAPLPPEYARTILTGIWDNTEILPPVETGLQGFGIRL
ncbi:metallophosphoesterase family protein [Altibacter sp. HG106]|uniref:metallophosphoesterase family protein n=1 Tax=Altibacter sp. HG106 TaxID=3023937 RepID=UPI00234FB813|nr:metallophosphoesterase family protein [Altibacter sp. HG106]MDC7994240.1 metallophosphoesterase family protein [Altibacter sp. HG106]